MTLWDWSIRAYRNPGVEEICLSLQDDDGQSVCLLLWAAWRGPVDAETLEAAVDAARSWQFHAIEPLRAVRRTLKKPVSDMDDSRRLDLRDSVKAAELKAERGLLEELEAVSGPPSDDGFSILDALAQASRVWGDRTPRERLRTLAGRLPEQGSADV